MKNIAFEYTEKFYDEDGDAKGISNGVRAFHKAHAIFREEHDKHPEWKDYTNYIRIARVGLTVVLSVQIYEKVATPWFRIAFGVLGILLFMYIFYY